MISVAVSASLLIAISIIPTAAAKWLQASRLEDPHVEWWDKITQLVMRILHGA